KPDAKPEAKPEAKPDAKPEAKPDAEPEAGAGESAFVDRQLAKALEYLHGKLQEPQPAANQN
ncbi:MAG: hypothetical protein ACKPEY_00785, partial [Planctomycetota bacterium]